MLETLDDVDWIGLGYPDLPKWIQALTSESKELREEAYYNLYPGKELEPLVFAPHVVPFLIELLTYDEVQEKVVILLLLMQWSSVAKVIAAQATEQPYRTFAQTLLSKIAKGRSTYQPFLETEDRDLVLQLLGYIE
jgi:hypothetical protein